MSGLCLYFGTELPDPQWAASLRDSDVVLEPYHPFVMHGGFAEAFPNCRRYIYVNPTTIDPWILERTENPPPLIGRDERWDLPRLDLTKPEAIEWAVNTAVAALDGDGGRAHGLFVDDLDRLLPDQSETAMEFLVQVELRHSPREPHWFLNRGFELWPLVECLDAVLLEDITPHLVGYVPVGGVRWMRDIVIANVRQARDRGVRVHSLGYKDQESVMESRSPDNALGQELAGLVDSVTMGADRRLHEWRTSK